MTNELETPLFSELREAKKNSKWHLLKQEGNSGTDVFRYMNPEFKDLVWSETEADAKVELLRYLIHKGVPVKTTGDLDKYIEEEHVEEGETPLFTEFKDNKSTPSFADFVDERRSIKSLPYLNESENAQVDQFVKLFESECDNDINNLDEGFLGKIVGGVAGFLVGPTIGRIVANALGIDRGILYDMFTSRLVSTALGAAIAKSVGKTPAR